MNKIFQMPFIFFAFILMPFLLLLCSGCCEPDCEGKCCGDDGCGGTCPNNCKEPLECHGCECATVDPCSEDDWCPEYWCCIEYMCVEMDCGNVECGPDPVCGKECGPCPPGQICSNLGSCESGVLGAIGDPCQEDADCETGMCLKSFIDGYCSSSCEEGMECPEGSHPTVIWSGEYVCRCLKACINSDDCRPGYECTRMDDNYICFQAA